MEKKNGESWWCLILFPTRISPLLSFCVIQKGISLSRSQLTNLFQCLTFWADDDSNHRVPIFAGRDGLLVLHFLPNEITIAAVGERTSGSKRTGPERLPPVEIPNQRVHHTLCSQQLGGGMGWSMVIRQKEETWNNALCTCHKKTLLFWNKNDPETRWGANCIQFFPSPHVHTAAITKIVQNFVLCTTAHVCACACQLPPTSCRRVVWQKMNISGCCAWTGKELNKIKIYLQSKIYQIIFSWTVSPHKFNSCYGCSDCVSNKNPWDSKNPKYCSVHISAQKKQLSGSREKFQ